MTCFCELDGVTQKVEQNLVDFLAITTAPYLGTASNIEKKLKLLLLCLYLKYLSQFIYGFRKSERLVKNVYFIGFNFGEIQDAIH